MTDLRAKAGTPSPSVLTPSQSGIMGEGGRKVLKTRVHILGRYLLEPGEGLSADTAARLVERARGNKSRLRTQLTLFSTGLRLGERGVFSSMPMEFVRYHRVSDLVSPVGHPSVLVMAVMDYEQRCTTVVQFKDDVCLRVVVDVIGRHRRGQDEDVARMSDLHSQMSSSVRRHDIDRVDGGRRDGGGRENWRLSGGQQAESSSTASHSMLDDDYAVIRRSRMISMEETEATDDQGEVRMAPPIQQQWQQQWQLYHKDEQPQQQKHQQRYQKKSQPQQQQPQQQQQKTSIQHASAGASASFDELETAAIFETTEGPPTLLNELVLRDGVVGGVGGGDSSGSRPTSSGIRMSQLPPEFVARVRVHHPQEDGEARLSSFQPVNGGDDDSRSSTPTNSERGPSGPAWAPLDDRVE